MRKIGYTLIEVLFVVIVVAILAAIAIPRLGVDYTTKMKVKTAAQRLVSDLRLTRRLAITKNENRTLSVDSSNNQYSFNNSEDTTVTRNIDSDITVITVSADADFIFKPLGDADDSSDTSISLSADGNQADITVTVATGRIGVSGP